MSDAVLREAFSFTEDDLSMNNSGYLTDAQKETLQNLRKQSGCAIRFATLSIILTILILMGVFLCSTDHESDGFLKALPYYAIFCGFFGLLYAFFTFYGFYRSRDLRNGIVRAAEGEARTWTKEYRTGTGYFAEVGGVQFRLHSEAQIRALSEHRFYRINYMRNPPVHFILSLQVLG